MNIQQQTTSEVADKNTVMADNEELDPQPPQEINNLFAATDFSSRSSSDSAKYKCACLKAKVICFIFYLLWNVQTHAVENYPLH